MATQQGTALSACYTQSIAYGSTGPTLQRITITADPQASWGDQDANEGVYGVAGNESYVFAPGLIDGLYDN